MATLNQCANRIASIINQPYNHELKERIKDMVKGMFANRIRQSVEKHGIDNILKLSFIAPVEELNYEDIFPTEYRISNKIKLLGTKYKVPTPVRLHSDAPFTFVGNTIGQPYLYESSLTSAIIRVSGRATSLPTGSLHFWFILNGRIIIINKNDSENDESTIRDNRPINEVLITGIFENPEEVLSYFTNNDGQDIELPLPNDMIEDIIHTILKVEFNIYPKDEDIKINSDVVTPTATSNNK